MSARRAPLSRYLVVGFTISMAVAAAVGSAGEARAQVDLNVQDRINTYAPPIVAVQPSLAPEVLPPSLAAQARLCTEAKIGTQWLPITHPAVARAIANKRRTNRFAAKDLKQLTIEELCKQANLAFPVKVGQPQPTTLKVSFPIVNPTYETNVLRSNQNSPGTSFGFGGTVLLTTAGARENDVIAFSAGSASARYSAFPSKSFDALVMQGFYQFFLDAYQGDGTLLNPKNPTNVPQNLITVDTLAVGFQNQATFMPTYRSETADLFTPQISLARQNMSLAGGGSDNQCFAAQDIHHQTPAFCYFANLSVTAGQTFSDVTSLQNANLMTAATLGKRFEDTDFILSLTTAATARAYENVAGGRQDLLLQIGPTLTYTPNKYIGLSVPVTYYQNYSSVSAAAWHGFVIQPTLTVAFSVEAAAR